VGNFKAKGNTVVSHWSNYFSCISSDSVQSLKSWELGPCWWRKRGKVS